MKNIIIILMIGLFASCSTTNVTNSWKDETANSTSIKNVMVIAMLPAKERALRADMENELVNNLNAQGFIATSSYAKYGPKSFEGDSETQINRKLKKNNTDGVITITLLDKNKEENYTPGSVRYEPYAIRYNRFFGYYQTYYTRVSTPGYYTTSTDYYFETNLYDVNKDKLLYSAQTQSFDPSTTEQIGQDHAKAIVKDMQKNNVLKLSAK